MVFFSCSPQCCRGLFGSVGFFSGVLLALMLMLMLMPMPSHSASLQVSVMVAESCVIKTPAGIAGGFAATAVQIKCAPGTTYAAVIDDRFAKPSIQSSMPDAPTSVTAKPVGDVIGQATTADVADGAGITVTY